MGTHFVSAGWLKEGDEPSQLVSIIERAMKEGQVRVIETPKDDVFYHVVADPNTSSELWYCMKGDEILSVNPHFHGTERFSLTVGNYESFEDEGEAIMFSKLSKGSEYPDLPVIFELADALNQSALGNNGTVLARIGGLGYGVEAYESQHEIPKDRFATQFFTPIGTMVQHHTAKSNTAKCDVRCRGVVKELRNLTNSWTNLAIYSIKLDTNVLFFEVLIDQASVTGKLKEGAFIQGDFWLTGMLL